MTNDLKQIDNEMQAILAELLMPGPPAAVQPQLARMPFPLPTESPVPVVTDLVDRSRPCVLPVQLMQTSGALWIFFTGHCKSV